jgi:hypothetical protein
VGDVEEADGLMVSAMIEYHSLREAVEGPPPSMPYFCKFSKERAEGNFISARVPRRSREEVDAKASGKVDKSISDGRSAAKPFFVPPLGPLEAPSEVGLANGSL